MNGFKIFLFVTVSCVVASLSFADIYEWTDEDGIKHYSNYAPPENSRILMKTKEEPYDEAADHARVEAERQAQLELARLEIAQREAELDLREAEAERRLAEADRLADEALREADSYFKEAENGRSTYKSYGFGCYDDYYGCRDPIYGRWYYRNENASIFFKKPPFPTPYRRHRYKRGYDVHYRNEYRNQYRPKSLYRSKTHHNNIFLHSRSGNIAGGSRIGASGRGALGRGNFSGRNSGIGRRR